MSELTEKELRFVDAWLINPNATQAAITAGYSPKTANELGSRALAKVEVRRAIAERQLALRRKAQVTQEDLIRQAARIAFADIRNVLSWDNEHGVTLHDSAEISADAAAAITEISEEAHWERGRRKDEAPTLIVKRKVKLAEKVAALNLIARMIGAVPLPGGTVTNQTLNVGTVEVLKALRDTMSELIGS